MKWLYIAAVGALIAIWYFYGWQRAVTFLMALLAGKLFRLWSRKPNLDEDRIPN